MYSDKFITRETANLAKKKGFPQEGSECYRTNGKMTVFSSEAYKIYASRDHSQNPFHNFECVTVSQSILQKWLREKCEIYVDVFFNVDIINSTRVQIIAVSYEEIDGEKVKCWKKNYNKTFPLLDSKYEFNVKKNHSNKKYQPKTFTYEEALEEGLIEALKMLEDSFSN